MELSKFGRIDALHVCDNLGDHMIGHVHCKFRDEEEASDALQVMNGLHCDGRRMEVEFSPVTDFREARCRDCDEEVCARGGFCNFLNVKPIPILLIWSMEDDCEADRIREQEIDVPKNGKKSGLKNNTKSASKTEKSVNTVPIVTEVVEGTAVPVESMQEVEVLGVTDRTRNLRRSTSW